MCELGRVHESDPDTLSRDILFQIYHVTAPLVPPCIVDVSVFHSLMEGARLDLQCLGYGN